MAPVEATVTSPMLDRRTRSLDESENAARAEAGVRLSRSVDGLRKNEAEAMADTQPISGLASSSSETLDASGPPVSLAHALRAARTPLIPGVDFRTVERYGDEPRDTVTASDRFNADRPRVDTLSPLDSVPPPAPYPLEPPPQRPSIVPPVRLGYQDAPQRAEGYVRTPRMRSDPPPDFQSANRRRRTAASRRRATREAIRRRRRRDEGAMSIETPRSTANRTMADRHFHSRHSGGKP